MSSPDRGTGRRTFLAAVASAAISAAQESAPYRIDCQSHLYVPELLALMERRQSSPRTYRKGADLYVVVNDWVRRVLPKHTDVDAKLADMDEAAIRTTMLSINDPGPELFAADGPRVARMVHDYIAGLMRCLYRTWMLRWAELDRCIGKLGFRGILLYSLDGKWPDGPQFRPLFRRPAEMGVPILLHPAYPTTFQETA
jgi:predicted TIM-barrel fold metal-dependent hydrolase